MDTLIENVYVDTEELLLDVTAVALKRKMTICIGIMAACLVVCSVLAFVLENMLLLLAAVVSVVMAILFIRMPKQAAYHNYDSKVDAYGQDIPETTVRFGERVEVEFEEEHVDFIYEEIQQVKLLKTCIVFEGRDRTWYYTPYDTFTIGSAKELLALLEERCPHLNIPRL